MFPGPASQLGLIMSSYRPNVRCAGPEGLPLDSCFDIVSLMPASTDQQVFGRRGEISVDVEIPDTFYSGG